jgi:hypothetical protein
MIGDLLLGRLHGQFDALSSLVKDVGSDAIDWRPPSGKWTSRENLAHLGRYHEVFLERIRRMLSEDCPSLARYRAEDDPEWVRWTALSTDDLLHRIRTLRRELTSLITGLSVFDLNRTGIHPLFGELTIPRWIDFFLLHEAHHLYTMMTRLGEAASTRAAEDARRPSERKTNHAAG